MIIEEKKIIIQSSDTLDKIYREFGAMTSERRGKITEFEWRRMIGVSDIGRWLPNLETVLIHAPVIKTWAFTRLQNLKRVELLEGVERIEMGAFANCLSLETVILPKSIAFISTSAFSGCPRLTDIRIPEDNAGHLKQSFGGLLDSMGALIHLSPSRILHGKLYIPSGTVSIPRDVFCGFPAGAITEVELPASFEDPGYSPPFWRDFPGLAAFSVSPESAVYKAMNGILYSADGKTLVAIPQAYPKKCVILPPEVESLNARSVNDVELESLIIRGDIVFGRALRKAAIESLQFHGKVSFVSGILPFARCEIGSLEFYNTVSFEGDVPSTIHAPAKIGTIVCGKDSEDALRRACDAGGVETPRFITY